MRMFLWTPKFTVYHVLGEFSSKSVLFGFAYGVLDKFFVLEGIMEGSFGRCFG